MLSDAVLQAIAAQIQAGYVTAGSTCVVFPYWPSPVGPPVAPGLAWLVCVEDTGTDEVLANGARGGNDVLQCRYHLPGLLAQPGAPTIQAIQQRSTADKMVLAGVFSGGIKANVGGAVIEAARKITVQHPRGGPYDAAVKTRVQLTWTALITVRTKLH